MRSLKHRITISLPCLVGENCVDVRGHETATEACEQSFSRSHTRKKSNSVMHELLTCEELVIHNLFYYYSVTNR